MREDNNRKIPGVDSVTLEAEFARCPTSVSSERLEMLLGYHYGVLLHDLPSLERSLNAPGGHVVHHRMTRELMHRRAAEGSRAATDIIDESKNENL
jgi:hypothetical protein